jgi:hypothetical protein
MPHATLVFLLGILVAPPQALRGQDTVAVSSSARARVYVAPSGIARVGVVERIAPDTLFLRPCRGCDAEGISREAVQHVDISIGRPDYSLRGVGIGVLFGAVVGTALIGSECHNTGGEHLWAGCGFARVGGGLIGGSGGLFVGGMIGRFWWREQWRPARLVWPIS